VTGDSEGIAPAAVSSTGLAVIAREWTRLGCIGFGGPPAHIALLHELCVERRGWLTDEEFEDAIATTNLLPGPGSTQLAIFCAWRLRGARGALVGGAGFVLPGLVATVALAMLFLAGAPPEWVAGAGAGAGAAVAAVALQAGVSLLLPGWRRVCVPATASAGTAAATPAVGTAPAGITSTTAGARGRRARWCAYVLAGLLGAAAAGPWLVVLLLTCGVVELACCRVSGARLRGATMSVHAWPLAPAVVAAVASAGGLGALAWTAFKVGALSYGGGFVIIPLMQADAVGAYGWMTDAEFLNAVAIGQVTPGPVVHTVAVVGYAAAGIGGAMLAAAVAFAPSFSFILLGGERFDRLRENAAVRAFLDGAGPAAVGAIVGSAIPLALALTEAWQFAVLTSAAVALLALRRGVVITLLGAGAAGALVALAGGSLPG
jgi:chromate transporter